MKDVGAERDRFFEAARQGDFDTALVWAGEAVDLIARVEDAATLVERIGQGAEAQLRTASRSLRSDGTRFGPARHEATHAAM